MDLKDVNKVAVIGAGTMGPGLAQVFACAGHPVSLYSRSEATLEKAMSVTAANMQTFAGHGLLSQDDIAAALARITPTQSLAEAGADAEPRHREHRREPRGQARRVRGARQGLPGRRHLHEQHLVPRTSTRSCRSGVCRTPSSPTGSRRPTSSRWSRSSGARRPPTRRSDSSSSCSRRSTGCPWSWRSSCPGFCINRFLRIIGREVFFLLDNGYMTAEQLDLAVKASIIPRAMVLGFVQRYDFTGLDLSLNNLQELGLPRAADRQLAEQPRRARREGRDGRQERQGLLRLQRPRPERKSSRPATTRSSTSSTSPRT